MIKAILGLVLVCGSVAVAMDVEMGEFCQQWLSPGSCDVSKDGIVNFVDYSYYADGVNEMALYYVSTTGNDTTGNGSIETPWATIAKAYSVVKNAAGESHTINVGVGTFQDAPAQGYLYINSGTKAITFKGAGKNLTIYEQSAVDYHIRITSGAAASHIKFEDMEIKRGAGVTHAYWRPIYLETNGYTGTAAPDLELENCIVRSVYAGSSNIYCGHNGSIGNLKIKAVGTDFISITSATNLSLEDVNTLTLSNCTFSAATTAILLGTYTTGITVTNASQSHVILTGLFTKLVAGDYIKLASGTGLTVGWYQIDSIVGNNEAILKVNATTGGADCTNATAYLGSCNSLNVSGCVFADTGSENASKWVIDMIRLSKRVSPIVFENNIVGSSAVKWGGGCLNIPNYVGSSRVENNTMHLANSTANGSYAIMFGLDAASGNLFTIYSPLIKNNVIYLYGTKGWHGILAGNGVVDPKVIGNQVFGAGVAGEYGIVHKCDGGIYFGNTSSAKQGFHVKGSRAVFVNNTGFSKSTGATDGTYAALAFAINGSTSPQYNYFYNNIFDGSDGDAAVYLSGTITHDTLIFNYNCFNAGAVGLWIDDSTPYANLPDAKAGLWTNDFTINNDGDSFTADPDFIDAAGGDFRLNVNSPCINAGQSTAGSGKTTIGAWQPEYVPQGSSRVANLGRMGIFK